MLRKAAGIRTEAEGSALADALTLVGQKVDDLVRRSRVEFPGCGAFQPADVAGKLNHCDLHPEADSQIGDVMLAGIACGHDHPLNAAVAGGGSLALRVVRQRLPAADGDGASGDRWLNLVTDLPRAGLGARELAGLYATRWSEEVGFLHLKHSVGLGDPRTRDLSRAAQELLGKLVLYDACSLGTSGVPEPAPGPAHPRAADRTAALKCFARMLRSLVRRSAFDVEACCARMSHSVRRGRGHPRRKRPKSPPKSRYRH